jgi:hypothetical protein
VHTFVRSGGQWQLDQVLTASDSQPGARFGAAVALSGDRAAVGAAFADGPNDAKEGKTYVFERDAQLGWLEQAALFAADGAADRDFAQEFDLEGDLLAVGARRHPALGPATGAVYLFEAGPGGWQQAQQLLGPSPGASFGHSVAVDGERIAVGAPAGVDSGSVHLYTRVGAGFDLALLLPDPAPPIASSFGYDVALSGAHLLVGAPFHSSASQSGAARLFVQTGATWTFAGNLQPLAGLPWHGRSVALAEDCLLVGAAGMPSGSAPGLTAHFLGAPWAASVDRTEVALDVGGVQVHLLGTCPPVLNGLHWLLGSASGTSLGLPLAPGIVLPLVPDAYLLHTAQFPHAPPLVGAIGHTDLAGRASASVAIPPGAPLALAGLQLHHAFAVFDGSTGALVGTGPANGLAFVPTKSIWEVGPGGQDFPSVAAALASPSVQAGHTLRLSPDFHGDVHLSKAVHLIGQPGATFAVGHLQSIGLDGFTIAGMRASHLTLRDAPGRIALDDVQVGALGAGSPDALYTIGSTHIENCGELVVSRSTFRGGDACYPDVAGAQHGITVIASTAVFIDSTFSGGQGAGEFGCEAHYPTAGHGMRIGPGSDVTLAASSAAGGIGPFGTHRSGVDVEASGMRIVGTFEHTFTSTGGLPPIQAGLDSQVRLSGVLLDPPLLSPGVTVLLDPEPFLRVLPADAPSSAGQALLHGPAGAWAWLLVSADAAYLPGLLPGLDPVWLDPAAPLLLELVPTQGHLVSTACPLPPHPGPPGSVLWVQAWFPAGSGLVTHVAQAVRRE